MDKNKEYSFNIIVITKGGISIVDFGKYQGRYNSLVSTFEYLTKRDLLDIASVYKVKTKRITITKLNPIKSESLAAAMIGVACIKDRLVNNEDELFKKHFDMTYEAGGKFFRAGIAIDAAREETCSYVLDGDEPIKLVDVIQRVYDPKTRGVRRNSDCIGAPSKE